MEIAAAAIDYHLRLEPQPAIPVAKSATKFSEKFMSDEHAVGVVILRFVLISAFADSAWVSRDCLSQVRTT
jgi:hypothetical protein